MDEGLAIVDFAYRHIQPVFDLHMTTHRAHAAELPEIFATDPNEDEIWHDLRSYLPSRFRLRRRSKFGIVCERESGLVGYLLYMIEKVPRPAAANDALVVTIYDICVREDSRGTGLGLRMVGDVRARFAGHAGQTFFSAQVWRGNDASRRLFQRAGFSPSFTSFFVVQGDVEPDAV